MSASLWFRSWKTRRTAEDHGNALVLQVSGHKPTVKSQWVFSVTMVHPEGNVNISTKFHHHSFEEADGHPDPEASMEKTLPLLMFQSHVTTFWVGCV